MLNRFIIIQVVIFGFCYMLAMMAVFPFLLYFGKPKLWQKVAEFLMSFPVDSNKIGTFSFLGVVSIFFLNGLFWGLMLIDLVKMGNFLISYFSHIFTGSLRQ